VAAAAAAVAETAAAVAETAAASEEEASFESALNGGCHSSEERKGCDTTKLFTILSFKEKTFEI